MKKINLLLLFIFVYVALKAQVSTPTNFINNGANIQIENNGIFYVGGNYTNNDGLVTNNGEMQIGGDWYNQLVGNHVFTQNSTGVVRFMGGTQIIGGLETTRFPSLTLSNGGEIQLDRNTETFLRLDLGSTEVITRAHQMILSNPDPSALSASGGLVNTNNGGAFVRHTNKTEAYLFFLGSKALNAVYPTLLKPNNVNDNIYAFSMINRDPDLDGFRRDKKEETMGDVNGKYYYQVAQLKGASPANITLFTKQTEMNYNWVTNWKNIQWERLPNVTRLPSTAYADIYNSLETDRMSLTANFETFNVAEKLGALKFYNAISPNGDNLNDYWEIKNIDIYPDNNLQIFDRSGNLVFRAEGYTSAKAWSGQNYPSGTYYYILRVNVEGTDKYYKGSITLVKN